VENYKPQPYDGRITLFRASERSSRPPQDASNGWSALASGNLEIIEVPGDHFTMLTEPFASTLAERMTDHLNRYYMAAG
jgi:thioesterase domain-containing protein